MQREMGVRRYLWLWSALVVSITASLAWQALDRQLPDGDEAGHLGAFYLFTTSIPDKGLWQTWVDAFTGPGDYPPGFYLSYAMLFRLLPAHWPFPTGLGLFLTLTYGLTLLSVAGLTGALVKRLSPAGAGGLSLSRPELLALAVAACATFPLFVAVARQAMPEPFLALWVTLTLWAAVASEGFCRWRPSLVAGLGLLMAFMTKQTTVLYLGLPLLWLAGEGLWMWRRRTLVGLGLVAGVGLPLPLLWLWLHWQDQVSYGSQSAEAKATVSWLEHLLYYPEALLGEGLGLFWSGVLGLSIVLSLGGALTSRLRDADGRSGLTRIREHFGPGSLGRAMVLLLSVGVLLVFVPKKYPRLLVPFLPSLACLVALQLGQLTDRHWRRSLVSLGVGLGVLQQGAVSFPVGWLPERLGLWTPTLYRTLDPDCPQEWIRRASDDELGFEAVMKAWHGGSLPEFKGHRGGSELQGAAALLLAEGADERLGTQIAFLEEPPIPCSYETTFNYAFHLSDYMRRRGAELDTVAVAETEPEAFQQLLPRVRLMVGIKPWCEGEMATGGAPTGTSGLPGAQLCPHRPEFALSGTFQAHSTRLPFTLYFYRRIQPAPAE